MLDSSNIFGVSLAVLGQFGCQNPIFAVQILFQCVHSAAEVLLLFLHRLIQDLNRGLDLTTCALKNVEVIRDDSTLRRFGVYHFLFDAGAHADEISVVLRDGIPVMFCRFIQLALNVAEICGQWLIVIVNPAPCIGRVS